MEEFRGQVVTFEGMINQESDKQDSIINKIDKQALVLDNFYKKTIFDIIKARETLKVEPIKEAPVAEAFDPNVFSVKKLNEGTGPLCPKGSKVKVHYTGKLLDGKKFDSSVDRNQPFDFTVGVGQVIKCWDEGITQLQKGQKAVLTCPSDYAYCDRGYPGAIPPKATLIFDVELIDFRP